VDNLRAGSDVSRLPVLLLVLDITGDMERMPPITRDGDKEYTVDLFSV
jgi:hypothetical protein